MEIKSAKSNDFNKFIPIKKEFLNEYGVSKKTRDFILKEFNEYLKKIFIIAIKNNEIIGYILGKIEKNNYEKYGYISEVFVKKDKRKQGISTILKDEFIKILKNKGIKICRIEVSPDNYALEVYKNWGFDVDKHRLSLRF